MLIYTEGTVVGALKKHLIFWFLSLNLMKHMPKKQQINYTKINIFKLFKKIITCKNSLSANVSQPIFPLNKHQSFALSLRFYQATHTVYILWLLSVNRIKDGGARGWW